MSIVKGDSIKCNSPNTNLECEGVIFLRLTFELISFSQDLIAEEVIGGPVEMKGETHWVLLKFEFLILYIHVQLNSTSVKVTVKSFKASRAGSSGS